MCKRGRLLNVLLLFFIMIAAAPAHAADRMYFSGIATPNAASGDMDVVVVWGELEGAIPPGVEKFNIYRKLGAGSYVKLNTGDINNSLMTAGDIRSLYFEPGEDLQRLQLITMLDEAVPGTGSSDFHTVLYNILNSDPSNPDYNPLQKQFLIRYSRNAARACGRAFIDRSVAPGDYTYMITGILSDTSETRPLGQFQIDASAETVLPEPEDFRQVRVGTCSDSRKNIDHARIHLNWTIPTSPEKISLRALTYGYDVYRSDSDLGTLNLRTGTPAGLSRINDVPIIASGNTPSEGMDAFLTFDDGEVLSGGEGLIPGTAYYYYIAARDLAGNYSETSGPLKAIVPDTRPPVVPWNVHSRREEVDTGGSIIPRLTLLWDQINNLNYLKNYSTGKNICKSTPKEICFVMEPGTCESGKSVCMDLDVVRYQVYRFDSYEEASEWGTDSDGDLWPDELEDTDEDGELDPGETDKCDPTSHPAGLPSTLVAQISQGDPAYTRTLSSGKKVMYFRDPVPLPNNKVYWYRITSEDSYGNRSFLSPPARAALWNRIQPDINGKRKVEDCDFFAKYYHIGEDYCENPDEKCKGEDAQRILSVIDLTRLSDSFALYEICRGDKRDTYHLIYKGSLNELRCLYKEIELANYNTKYKCGNQCGDNAGGYAVRFYSGRKMIAESDPFYASGLCEPLGCVVLDRVCEERYIDIHIPGDVPPVLPGDPINICVGLEPGQCAKIYQKIAGKFSAIHSFCNNTSVYQEICDDVDIQTIVSADICLGLRIFSKNHVGSAMGYFQCFPVMSGPPSAPLLESVTAMGSASSPNFELKWSSQSDGIAAFIIQRKGDSDSDYTTVWDLKPDGATGQFIQKIDIDPSEIEDEWCFKIRAIDDAFQMSSWSNELCEIWGEKESVVSLRWPHVTEPPDGGKVTAFFLANEKVGAIVLSDDVTNKILSLNPQCQNVPVCDRTGKGCLSPVVFSGCSVCSSVKSWNKLGNFIVYRQEENKNYVQVSPLVETIHCLTQERDETYFVSTLDDPMVNLVYLDNTVVQGVDPSVESELTDTTRLLFIDWYPHKRNTKVRYHVIGVDEDTDEPVTVYTSDWVEMK